MIDKTSIIDILQFMEDLLRQLGLNEKEAKIYVLLLTEGALTAAAIAKKTSETRTNIYMILERLTVENLVITDDMHAVRRFRPADPTTLKTRLLDEQQQYRQKQAAFQAALPELSSLFNLSQHRPGITYFEGLKGFKTLLEDNSRTRGSIDIIGSDIAPNNKEAWEILQKALAKRKARGIPSRLIFHEAAMNWPHISSFPKKGMDVRFWGREPLEGEVVLYDNKIAFTVYQPTLIVAVMTNDILTQTFKTIFEQIWESAKPLKV